MTPQITASFDKVWSVEIDGRPIAPLKYRVGRRENGTVFYDAETKLYVKCGAIRAVSERRIMKRAICLGLQQHLAPIIASGPCWNAFAAMIPDADRETGCYADGYPEVQTIIERLGVSDSGCRDNWGWVNGIPVLWDYEE